MLNKLPKSLQPAAMDTLHQIWVSGKLADANKAFIAKSNAKYPGTTD